MQLLKVDTVEQARDKLEKATKDFNIDNETIHISKVEGRVLSVDAIAKQSVPEFRKSTVDGYAVVSKNTQGVTESIPVFLEVIEEVQIGTAAKNEIKPGQCAYVPTGGMVPQGADAMVMVEYCEHFDEKSIAVYDAVSPGRNIIQIGEDIKENDLFLKKGTTLRPQEIGALAAEGYDEIQVFTKPRITIISTGDELVGAKETPEAGQIRDINTYALEAQCMKHNIEIVKKVVLKDKEELLRDTIKNAMENSDIVVASGGSSQGKKDFTAKVINELSQPGVFTHGIALKPGKPTIIAYDDNSKTLLMGLPGHPVAAMIVFEFFVVWLLMKKMGQKAPKKLTAKMETNVAGGNGRASCLMVELVNEGNEYIAKPILGKSGLVTTLTKSDGYTFIETNKEGLKEGEIVKVTLL